MAHDPQLVDPNGAEIPVPPQQRGFGFEIPDIPLSVVVDVARLGVQFGIGLAALAVDAAKNVALEAIDRGATIEREGLDRLKTIEQQQVAYMKDYLKRAKAKADAPSGSNIEAHVEEALKTHAVPTRDDLRELADRIAALDAKLSQG